MAAATQQLGGLKNFNSTAQGSSLGGGALPIADGSSSRRAPSIAVGPSGRGGGGLRPISETFKVNAVNGTMSLSIPVPMSAGRGDFTPFLQLSYDSGSGNGPFGLGWTLSTRTITRKTAKRVPLYDESDVFILSGAEDLVPERQDGLLRMANTNGWSVQRFRPRIDDVPMRVERWTNASDRDDVHWRTISADNVTTVFGNTDASRIYSSGHSGRKQIFSWLTSLSYDAYGNAVEYQYKADDSAAVCQADGRPYIYENHRSDTVRGRQRYLKSVKYGNTIPNRSLETWEAGPYSGPWHFELVLDYGEHAAGSPTTEEDKAWPMRLDPFSVHTSGFEVRSYRLCRRFLMFHHFPKHIGRQDCLVSSTELSYDESPTATVLKSYTLCGHVPVGARDYKTQSYPPFEFEYNPVQPLQDLPIQSLDTSKLPTLPGGQGSQAEWLDLDGEGAPGMLNRLPGGAWEYYRNDNVLSDDTSGTCFRSRKLLRSQPWSGMGPDVYFEDLDRSGAVNAVFSDTSGRIVGFTERDNDSWKDFASFVDAPNFNIAEKPVQRVDLTGNGLHDLLLEDTLTNEFRWYECLAKRGFGPEKRVPQPLPATPLMTGDGQTAVYFTDMSGDGLADILHVSNGRISYWPNLGHGRFGDEVVMGGAPLMDHGDQFSHTRIRLADIDGSGTTDLLYLPANGGVTVYYNLAGNSWSTGHIVASFPVPDHLSSVFVASVRGDGLPCLCWSRPDVTGPANSQIQYIRLGRGRKAHLLSTYRNGIGVSTTISYKPSTWFYFNDERQGRPWRTKLPFPVHCVEEIKVVDNVGLTSSSTRYAYHDGYFDGIEREFRGFGIVEEWDAKTFVQGKAKLYQRPSVRTKTWYYTGTSLLPYDDAALPAPTRLSPSVLPHNLAGDDYRSGLRALKSKQARQEIYSEDGSDKAPVPYSTVQSTFKVKEVQAASAECPAVFSVEPKEVLTVHSERELDDPRREHELILQTNDFGDVLKSAHISYGKEKSSLADPTDREEQQRSVLTYSETDFTNAIDGDDVFSKPQMACSRKYQIFGHETEGLLDHTALEAEDCAFFRNCREIPASAIKTRGTQIEKVLVSESRAYYRSDDMSKTLPISVVEPFSVLDQSFQLALTKDCLQSAYGSVDLIQGLKTQDLLEAAGYVDVDRDGRWWIASDKQMFTSHSSPDLELSTARQSFFTPVVTINAFKSRSFVELDEYLLFPVKAIDALGNTIASTYDYTHLTPTEMTCANGNRQLVAYDAFGDVVGSARCGKKGEKVGDSLDGFAALLDAGAVQKFLAEPSQAQAKALLGNASQRTMLDMAAYYNSKVKGGPPTPNFQVELQRTEHAAASEGLYDVMISINYMNGHGSPMQEATLVSDSGDHRTWRMSGRVVHDNKAMPVRVFQPYHATSHLFDVELSVDQPGTTQLYDALGREVGVLLADHTWSKSCFNAWQLRQYDVGDTILTSDPSLDPDVGGLFHRLDKSTYLPTWCENQRSRSGDVRTGLGHLVANKSKVYHDTPTIIHLDALGRSMLTVSDLGSQNLETRLRYDCFGNICAKIDSLGRLVEQNLFDMLGRPLCSKGMDNGNKWSFPDCESKPVLTWNSRGTLSRTAYDELGRELATWISRDQGKTEWMATKAVYGETETNAESRNLRGHLIRAYDQSGVQSNISFDFKGNCEEISQQHAKEYKTAIDWKGEPALELTTFTSRSRFDALNRAVEAEDALGNITRRTFDLAGSLKRVEWKDHGVKPWTDYISDITYEADALISRIAHGNNTVTSFQYDALSRELLSRRTLRDKQTVIEDIHYAYDCMRKIVHEIDLTQQAVYFRNSIIEASKEHSYDSVGQLVQSRGREQIDVKTGGGSACRPHSSKSPFATNAVPGDGSQLCAYLESYNYDRAGNIVTMKHEALNDSAVAGWTRSYFYEEKSLLESKSRTNNRLSRTEVGELVECYGYDGDAGKNGCMTKMPGYSRLTWDYMDKLQSSSTQRVNDGTPETTWYVYNASGKRVRKVIESYASGESTPTMMKETLYVGDSSIYRVYNGDGKTTVSEKASVAVMGIIRIALVEYDCKAGADASLLIRYQTSDNLELDDQGQVVSFEEYSPFGATTYLAHHGQIEAPSKYRYASYERDRETGLHFVNARYYAAWLGRWMSPDPIGTGDGLNVFAYVGNDPINNNDPTGTCQHMRNSNQALQFSRGEGFDNEPRTMPWRTHVLIREMFPFDQGKPGLHESYNKPRIKTYSLSGSGGDSDGGGGGGSWLPEINTRKVAGNVTLAKANSSKKTNNTLPPIKGGNKPKAPSWFARLVNNIKNMGKLEPTADPYPQGLPRDKSEGMVYKLRNKIMLGSDLKESGAFRKDYIPDPLDEAREKHQRKMAWWSDPKNVKAFLGEGGGKYKGRGKESKAAEKLLEMLKDFGEDLGTEGLEHGLEAGFDNAFGGDDGGSEGLDVQHVPDMIDAFKDLGEVGKGFGELLANVFAGMLVNR